MYLHFLFDEFGKVSQFVHDFARPLSSQVVASRPAHALGYLQTLASFGKVLLSHLEDCPDPAVLGLLKPVPPLRQLLPDPQNTLPHGGHGIFHQAGAVLGQQAGVNILPRVQELFPGASCRNEEILPYCSRSNRILPSINI